MNSVRTMLVTQVLLISLIWGGVSALHAQTELPVDAGHYADAGQVTLGHSGYLVIEGVRDTLTAFSWQRGPGPGRHSLVWAAGTLSLPDSLFLDEFGLQDAGVVCQAELSGVGGSGQLVFGDGIYRISEPLVLSDGIVTLHISGGELEVRGDQIRYRHSQPQDKKNQANYVFLAGLILLIIVLMRRARRQINKH